MFQGDEIRELPTARNVNSLLALTPGITSNYAPGTRRGRLRRRRRRVLQPWRPRLQRRRPRLGPRARPLQRRLLPAPSDSSRQSTSRLRQQRHQPEPGPRHGRRRVINAGSSVRDRRPDRRLHRGHRQRAGSQHPGVRRARRVGNRRRLDQHRAAHRRQPVRRRLQHDLHHGSSGSIDNNGALSDLPDFQPEHQLGSERSRRVGRPSAARSSATACGSTRSAATRDHKASRSGGDFWPNRAEGKWGYNYQPDRSQPSVAYKNMWQERERPHHVAGDAEEQVQRLLGRAGLLPGPCHGVVSVFTSPESWWSVAS